VWREFLRFANSGAVGTAAHYATLWGLVSIGSGPVGASALGAVVGAGVNYVLNYHWTFGSDLPHRKTLPRFLTIAVFSLALNTLLMALLTSGTKLHYLAAQVFATGACLILNYLASRFWAFQGNTR
jgi:putative flippase GtrA